MRRTKNCRRRGRAGAFIAFLLLFSAFAFAQGDAKELAAARRVYAQGLTLEAAGDWAGALSSFEEVARIKMTPQVRFHIARCKEKLGRLNEALGGYRLAEYEAAKTGAKDKELVEEAQAAREALEARIPKLVILRGKGADAIKVELDAVILGDAQIGQEIAVDPGPHVVTGVVMPGKSFKKSVNVAEREVARVVLDVPAGLVADTKSEAEDEPARSLPPEDEPHTPAPAPDEERSSSALPWVIGGLGVVSLVASAVFYKMKNDAEQELEAGCIGRTCPDTLEETQARGERSAMLSGVTLGLGVIGIGTATVMLLAKRGESTPAAARRPAALAPAFVAHPNGLGVALGGGF